MFGLLEGTGVVSNVILLGLCSVPTHNSIKHLHLSLPACHLYPSLSVFPKHTRDKVS